MTAKFSISLPDEMYEEVKTLAEQQGTTVSGWFADLARQRLDADHRSRALLAERIEHDRAADPDGHARMADELRRRMREAQVAARHKADKARATGVVA
ncbi:ribbon-helix-helix domain-containing protein [Planomonospora venezuelensis]|uniref:Arc/MetJ-type ribon-helix-helix transcriptional regulator n=1 Tax=Planomonospora venezuelensis TaxID=1999 RepID=A0A841DET6_PLAVE|nr:ribbon-helix-helix protein, CopG family [Planomonospora venezuelensis]MBB5967273.1 Arc/MetJ-type ribon-helix-helix transcriptional regulator [Planomonospora venezuelensis]